VPGQRFMPGSPGLPAWSACSTPFSSFAVFALVAAEDLEPAEAALELLRSAMSWAGRPEGTEPLGLRASRRVQYPGGSSLCSVSM
jgi:hypothetical protein